MKKRQNRSVRESITRGGKLFFQITRWALVMFLIVFVIAQLLFSSKFERERQVVIQAPAELIMPLISDLRERERWSDWKTRDPSVRFVYPQPETAGASGGVRQWVSETGYEGEQRVVSIENSRRLETAMDFGFRGWAKTVWTLEEEANQPGTLVTWSIQSDMSRSLLGSFFASGIKKQMETSFDGDLESLKRLAESQVSSF